MLQLSEEQRREVAQSKDPTSWADAFSKTRTPLEHRLNREATDEEVDYLIENELVRPVDSRTIEHLVQMDTKWVFKYKKTLDGLLDGVRA